jgi:tRNA (cytidine/uridine-2'-O-)-methyltransferase
MYHVALVNPQIPNNTGNIGRLCAATCSHLHLLKPLGFEITDSRVKRAGLDYWPELSLTTHENWEDFRAERPGRLWLFSARANQNYSEVTFQENDTFVFGCEATGLPPELQQLHPESLLNIPLDNPKVRSLNLANAVAVVLFEAKRQAAVRLSRHKGAKKVGPNEFSS